MAKSVTEKLYNTKAKRLAYLNKEGHILTFKKSFNYNGKSLSQIIVKKLETNHKKQVRILGYGLPIAVNSPWYENINMLIDAIDWKWMEESHAIFPPKTN